MSLQPLDWHTRYLQQAGWTRPLRQHLFDRLNLTGAQRVLEVGCGTGAVLVELEQICRGEIHGLDIDPSYLNLASVHVPGASLVRGDAHLLPYADGSLNLVCCHFLLLWVADPQRVVAEMRRVARPGGAVLILAEPDYGGRIDYPAELAVLGEWQAQSLRHQGADPLVGRRLRSLLAHAGLVDVESGVLGGSWSSTPPSEDDLLQEWAVLRSDLERLPEFLPAQQARVDSLEALDRQALSRGERTLFVPTFYAWGRC